MRIEEKIELIKKDFMQDDWEAKYEKIIDYGKKLTPLSDEYKTDDLKVKGCQSQVWIRAQLNDKNEVLFEGDSDALIVRGLVAIVLKVYSGEKPESILKTEPLFLREIGFETGLSPSRSNGLYSMIKQIKYYATAFQYLLSK
jgi:cysteine desulfuration protein SufE